MARSRIIAALAGMLLIAGTAGATESTTLEFAEPSESLELVDAADVVTYEAALPGLGELLEEPLTVTDEELAAVGVQPVDPLQLQPGGPDDFVVDDDLAQCPDADFTTATGIQQAIVAASPGATIRVCPGTYTPINVHKPLTIYAPEQHGQATQCKESIPPDPTKQAIIDSGGTNVSAVQLLADDILFYGFTVQNVTGNAGILASRLSSGTRSCSTRSSRTRSGST